MTMIRTAVLGSLAALVLAVLGFGDVANATEPAPEPRPVTKPCQTVGTYIFNDVPDDGGKDCVPQNGSATNGFGGSVTSTRSPTILEAFSFEMTGCPKTSATSVQVLGNLKDVRFVNFTDERRLTQLHRFAVRCREERKDVSFFSTLVLQAFDNEVTDCPKWTRMQVHQDLRSIVAGTQFASKEAVLILRLAGSAAQNCARERDKK